MSPASAPRVARHPRQAGQSIMGRLARSAGLATALLLLALFAPPGWTAARGTDVLATAISGDGLSGGASVVVNPTTATAAVKVGGLAPGWRLVASVQAGSCAASGPVLALLSGVAPASGVMRLWGRVPARHVATLRSAATAGRLSVTVRNKGRTACAALGAPPAPGTSAVPDFRHVFVIVMENREYGQIVGSSDAPFLNALAPRYGLATAYDAVAHPSEPNYVALFSGSTQGVSTDGTYDLPARNLADQLESHGRTWRVFAQDVPAGCYAGEDASGGADGAGTYARRHEPAISFTDIAGSAARCANIADFAHFSPSAADFELIVPNVCNDMHDCSTAAGDAFLASFVPRITGSAAFANSVLFITWDEGTTDAGGGGHVATLVVSPETRAGARSAVAHDHYSLVRTIEDAWALGCMARTCSANDMREFFVR